MWLLLIVGSRGKHRKSASRQILPKMCIVGIPPTTLREVVFDALSLAVRLVFSHRITAGTTELSMDEAPREIQSERMTGFQIQGIAMILPLGCS